MTGDWIPCVCQASVTVTTGTGRGLKARPSPGSISGRGGGEERGLSAGHRVIGTSPGGRPRTGRCQEPCHAGLEGGPAALPSLLGAGEQSRTRRAAPVTSGGVAVSTESGPAPRGLCSKASPRSCGRSLPSSAHGGWGGGATHAQHSCGTFRSRGAPGVPGPREGLDTECLLTLV